MRRALLALLLVAAAAAGLFAWWRVQQPRYEGHLVLYGHVELRQVELAFHHNERVVEVFVEEGDRVEAGQVLARLDTSRLMPQVAQAQAQVAAQRQVVARLKAGSRPEEIAQARAQVAASEQIVARLKAGSRPEEIAQAEANVTSAEADAANAQVQFERAERLFGTRAISQEEFDNARTLYRVANARVAVAQKALDLAVAGPRAEEIAEAEARLAAAQHALELVIAGPRAEEIAEAEAQLQSREAQLALLEQQLADAELKAPSTAIVRTRLMEPGEMASPQRPAFSLAITDLKWVRASVSGRDLGSVAPGMATQVEVDSFPGRPFDGWIGFISPVAEFTPKTVQTEELRPSLVYEVRVFVKDPTDELRLGMPATVHLAPQRRGAEPAAGVHTAEAER